MPSLQPKDRKGHHLKKREKVVYEKEKAMREGSVRGMYEMRGNDYNVSWNDESMQR